MSWCVDEDGHIPEGWDHILNHARTLSHGEKFDSLTSAVMTCQRAGRLSHVWPPYCIHPSGVCVCVGVPEREHVSVLGIAFVSRNLTLLHSYSASVCSIWSDYSNVSWAVHSQTHLLLSLNTAAFTVWIEFSAAEQMFHRRKAVFSVSQAGSWSFSAFLSFRYLQTPTASSL